MSSSSIGTFNAMLGLLAETQIADAKWKVELDLKKMGKAIRVSRKSARRSAPTGANDTSSSGAVLRSTPPSLLVSLLKAVPA